MLAMRTGNVLCQGNAHAIQALADRDLLSKGRQCSIPLSLDGHVGATVQPECGRSVADQLERVHGEAVVAARQAGSSSHHTPHHALSQSLMNGVAEEDAGPAAVRTAGVARILYVGDHPHGDVAASKESCGWDTMNVFGTHYTPHAILYTILSSSLAASA